MGGGAVWICSRGSHELSLGFRNETLRQVILTKLDILARLFGRRKSGYAQGSYLIKQKGSLAERGLRVRATDALKRIKASG